VNSLILFLCAFVAVFALGLQSKNVNQDQHWAATFTSLLISLSNIYLYKLMPDSGWLEIASYMVGAVCGINFGMWFHRRFLKWWRGRQRRDEHADPRMCDWHPPTDTH